MTAHKQSNTIEALQAENEKLSDLWSAIKAERDELRAELGPFEKYLKEGETPIQRLEREIKDGRALMNVYGKALAQIQELQQQQDTPVVPDDVQRDVERYRWLLDNCSYSYAMQPDSPAEHGIEYQWQQGTYEERDHGINKTIDSAIAAMKGAA
jgi:DNA repair exonuclease SbcCD ATPase subunit